MLFVPSRTKHWVWPPCSIRLGEDLMEYLSRAMRKSVLCHMRTTKAQISLRIRILDFIAEISRL